MRGRHQLRMRRGALAVVVAATSIVLGALAVRAVSVNLACMPAQPGTIVESQEFTPYGEQLTTSPDRPMTVARAPMNLDAGSAALPSNMLDGLPLRTTARDGGEGVYQFFLDESIGPEMTVSEFAAAGGIRYIRLPADRGPEYVADVLKDLPGRAIPVDIGGQDGVLTWADPDAHGVRPHHLQWSDGAYVYMLIAVRTPEAMVSPDPPTP